MTMRQMVAGVDIDGVRWIMQQSQPPNPHTRLMRALISLSPHPNYR